MMGGAGGRGASHRLIKTAGEAQAAQGVSSRNGESMMRSMKGAWLWKGRLGNNRNTPAPRTALWIGGEETQKESGKPSERWLKSWPSGCWVSVSGLTISRATVASAPTCTHFHASSQP